MLWFKFSLPVSHISYLLHTPRIYLPAFHYQLCSMKDTDQNVTTKLFLDGWTEHLAVPFVKRPTNAQGSSWFFINTLQIFYPDMFRHIVAILRGLWVPEKLLKQCSALWACVDYDPFRVANGRKLATREGSQSTHAQNAEHCLSSLSGTHGLLRMATICRNMSG
jgi:hypothetical protein